MNKTIAILIIIVIVLTAGIGLIYFYLTKEKAPVLNINEPPVAPEEVITVENEILSLMNSIEDFEFVQISRKFKFLEDNLPFNFNGQDFSEINQFKNYLTEHLLNRDDYANKEKFINVFQNYIFSSLFLDLLTEKFKDINNYAYYKKFRDNCPDILTNNLKNNEKDNFRDNLITQKEGTMEKFDFFDAYLSCPAPLNLNLCDGLFGETDFDKRNVSLSSKCNLIAKENLTFYYFLLSELECDAINFSKLSDFCLATDCATSCKILRRVIQPDNFDTALNSLNLLPSVRLKLQAFYYKDEIFCEQIPEDSYYAVGVVNECKNEVRNWLAIQDKNANKLKELDNKNFYFFEYVLENFSSISKLLDDQVINQGYDYNLNYDNLINFCTNKYQSLIQESCVDALEDFNIWFEGAKP